jgi:hypothetical protein
MTSHQLGGGDSGDPTDDAHNGLEIVGDCDLIVESENNLLI